MNFFSQKTIKKTTPFSLIACSLFLTFTSVSSAQDNPGANGPCKTDIQKFCGNVHPGEGRILFCLKAYEDQLSAECKAAGEKMKAKGKEIHDACGADHEKFCKDADGPLKSFTCLKEHEDKLSAKCKATLPHKK